MHNFYQHHKDKFPECAHKKLTGQEQQKNGIKAVSALLALTNLY